MGHQSSGGVVPSCVFILLLSFAIVAQVPSPRSVLGFHPTDDRTIADWNQIADYFARLDKASKNVAVREIGKSTLGRPLIVVFISSSRNIKNLEKYRQMNARLADPRTVGSESELASLIKDGKTIVSIACSIHSTEIVASQMSMNLAYDLATAKDAETKEILENTILLLLPSSNPDGIDIVANWYRKTLGTKSEGTAPPELYHHYAGHDNNRDWFMLNLAETQAITKFYWREWFPQFVYDIHQQGQNASRFVIPPFFDPPNPRIAPSILREVGLVGYKMAADLQAKGIQGVATNSTYDTWWHGGYRSAPYYHNSIGILSEAASANLMSPVTIKPEDLRRSRGARGLPSLLETATNFPDAWPGGDWRPKDIADIEMTASKSLLSLASKYRGRYLRNFYDYGKANLELKKDEPVAFIIGAGQPNGESISRLLEILMAQGIEVHRLTTELHLKMSQDVADFHEMPLGSFLVWVNQPQKNNILSLFERQVYPDRRNANGEAEVPYDVAGWTLPLQMGIQADTVWSVREEAPRRSLVAVQSINEARSTLNLSPAAKPFAKIANAMRTNSRVGLYKGFTSSMDEGWTRFVLDTHQIPFRSITDADMRSGRLDFDAIILPADGENTILGGLSADRYPEEFTGGIGEAGVENLKKFVKEGGRLICFDDSCDMVIKRFNLPVKNVLVGLTRAQFYNPGSVVGLDVDTRHPIAMGLRKDTAAYFSNSSAFDFLEAPATASGPSSMSKMTVIARYASSNALLSGWMVGEKNLNGKPALIEAGYGKGSVVLFGFRPQHRGQSWGTFPFIFNALEK